MLLALCKSSVETNTAETAKAAAATATATTTTTAATATGMKADELSMSVSIAGSATRKLVETVGQTPERGEAREYLGYVSEIAYAMRTETRQKI